LFVFFNLEFFLQGGQQCWVLWALLTACPYITDFYSILYVCINWANKDACLLASVGLAASMELRMIFFRCFIV